MSADAISEAMDATAAAMRQRILAAAGATLATLPLSKLTMEDIARGAGIARQTIYKHFANRDEIVIALFVAEIDRTHKPALLALHAQRRDADQLATMFLTQVDLAHQWRLLDHTFDPRLAPRVAELVLSSDALAECNQRLWQPILADYQDAGVVRVDLDLNQTVRWMTYQAVWFLSHPDALTADPEERRSYVRTFLVSGMLA